MRLHIEVRLDPSHMDGLDHDDIYQELLAIFPKSIDVTWVQGIADDNYGEPYLRAEIETEWCVLGNKRNPDSSDE